MVDSISREDGGSNTQIRRNETTASDPARVNESSPSKLSPLPPPSSATAPDEFDKDSYQASVDAFLDSKLSSDPGYFAKSSEERHHEQNKECPLPSHSSLLARRDVVLPKLVLPLRIHLVRSPILGCSDSLNTDSVRAIVRTMNETYWEPRANIRFDLDFFERHCNKEINSNDESNSDDKAGCSGFAGIEECVCPLETTVQEDFRYFIDHKLRRGPDGKMMHKAERKTRFLDVLLSSMDYKREMQPAHSSSSSSSNNNINNNNNNNRYNNRLSYDVWFLDMTGHQSQGICIDRRWRTVVMGERSTKGYPEPTKRPHDCLAKTMAHELGHALDLGHPLGLRFEDGTPQVSRQGDRVRPNLMTGGADRNGGGGHLLEDGRSPWRGNRLGSFWARPTMAKGMGMGMLAAPPEPIQTTTATSNPSAGWFVGSRSVSVGVFRRTPILMHRNGFLTVIRLALPYRTWGD